MMIFKTSQIAKMCGVAMITVGRWIDTGLLKGHRIPGSRHRRVWRDDLIRFLKKHDLPTDHPDLKK